MLALHKLHHLLAALVELLVGLPGVLHVLLAHLAQVLVLQVQSVHLPLHYLNFLLVVAVHLHRKVTRSVYSVRALLHENDLLLQLLHLPLVLLQLFNGRLVAPLGVALLLEVRARQGGRLGVTRMAVLAHQLLYDQRLALQLGGLVLALLSQPGILLRQLVDLPQQAGHVAALRASAHLNKVQLILQLNHPAIVPIVVPALLQLQLETLYLLQELRVGLLQLAILAGQQLKPFASMRGLLLRESPVLLRQSIDTLL